MTSDMLSPDALLALARKYRTMMALRASLPAHPQGGEEAREETESERAELRALAAEFPGALRELDTLPDEELRARAEALEAAAAGAEPARWMTWMDAYHALMREALAIRRGSPAEGAFAESVKSPPHGRIMAAVFAELSIRFSLPQREIWDALFPPRKGDRPYRR
jgi:hypothetical protein